VFQSFDREPFASASIAQVYRATTLDGRKVAVKVQKPAIPIQLEFDLCEWDLSRASSVELSLKLTVVSVIRRVVSDDDVPDAENLRHADLLRGRVCLGSDAQGDELRERGYVHATSSFLGSLH
jgi:hypothetical protein